MIRNDLDTLNNLAQKVTYYGFISQRRRVNDCAKDY